MREDIDGREDDGLQLGDGKMRYTKRAALEKVCDKELGRQWGFLPPPEEWKQLWKGKQECRDQSSIRGGVVSEERTRQLMKRDPINGGRLSLEEGDFFLWKGEKRFMEDMNSQRTGETMTSST